MKIANRIKAKAISMLKWQLTHSLKEMNQKLCPENLYHLSIWEISELSAPQWIREYVVAFITPTYILLYQIYTVRHDISSWRQLLDSKRKPYEGNFPSFWGSLINIDAERVWKPVKQNYWTDPKSHKAFFDKIAKEKKFDPLIAENWYKITLKDINNEVWTYGL